MHQYGLANMTMHVNAFKDSVVKVVLISERKTVLLVFLLAYLSGKVHKNLDDGGLLYDNFKPEEVDVLFYATFCPRYLEME
jgi:hypothetical protein